MTLEIYMVLNDTRKDSFNAKMAQDSIIFENLVKNCPLEALNLF